MSGTPQQMIGNQVVRVSSGSDTDLDAWFKAVQNPSEYAQLPQQGLPLRQRDLPDSFFRPPEPQQTKGQHSREGSVEGSYRAPPPIQSPPSSLTINHPRAHSSPATLQQTLRAVPTPPQHPRQRSYDGALDEGPLPPGWGVATHEGQRYFLNHLDQITTWHDPRKSISTSALNQQQQQLPPPQTSPVTAPLSPSNIQAQNLGPLPPGWEQATTPNNEVYFINHVDKTTSWFDPRLSEHMQRPTIRQGQGNLPVVQMQSPPQAPSPGSQQRMTQAERQRQMQLRNLQMEKEMLRKRQEELARKGVWRGEQLLRQHLIESSEVPLSQSSEMTSPTDPFLGQNNNADNHARQESADSGLGGMGTSYSLPRTPEDFLRNVDEMDTTDGGHTGKIPGLSEFGNMDIGPLGDGGDTTNMDGDDLVPSLQEVISTDLLHEVESVLNSTKIDNSMTWL